MIDHEVAPDPQLMESMRAVGYTIETAIADIIDNSIAAGADRVDVRFQANPEPLIGIVDNGSGMDEKMLLQAMRLAGRPPSDRRQPHDLGRFGLGLKTASLSQAKRVTVATKHGSALRAVRWDLDYLKATGRWSLQVLDATEIQLLPWVESVASYESGTLVLWDKLDQIHASAGEIEQRLDEMMMRVRNHLSLVFHRFTGAVTPPLTKPMALRINGAQVPKIDPFLTGHRGTQVGPEEPITIRDSVIKVQPYTLPYISKLTSADKKIAFVAGSLRDSQGFYIYRAGRLVLWGTWFRIMPRDELAKLARVRVDMPNTLDDLWALDIKKSSAIPPPEVTRRLKRIADRIVAPSRRVHTFKGRPVEEDSVTRLWNLIDDRGTFRYELNRDHPLVTSLYDTLDGASQAALGNLLGVVESTFPVEDAYNRLGTDNTHRPAGVDNDQIMALARLYQQAMRVNVETLVQHLALVEPFNGIVDLKSFLKEALDGGLD